MHFGTNHAPGAGLIALPVDLQSGTIPLRYNCPHHNKTPRLAELHLYFFIAHRLWIVLATFWSGYQDLQNVDTKNSTKILDRIPGVGIAQGRDSGLLQYKQEITESVLGHLIALYGWNGSGLMRFWDETYSTCSQFDDLLNMCLSSKCNNSIHLLCYNSHNLNTKVFYDIGGLGENYQFNQTIDISRKEFVAWEAKGFIYQSFAYSVRSFCL